MAELSDAERREAFARFVSESPSPWYTRTQLLAKMIPSGLRVADVGAGNQELGIFLGERCKSYTASDLMPAPGLVSWDVENEDAPERMRGHDRVVCAGLLEYVAEPVQVLRRVRACAPVLLMTYALAEWRTENELRQEAGAQWWRSCLTRHDLRGALTDAGWRPHRSRRWNRQLVVVARRRPET